MDRCVAWGKKIETNGAYLCWPDGFAQMIQIPVQFGFRC